MRFYAHVLQQNPNTHCAVLFEKATQSTAVYSVPHMCIHDSLCDSAPILPRSCQLHAPDSGASCLPSGLLLPAPLPRSGDPAPPAVAPSSSLRSSRLYAGFASSRSAPRAGSAAAASRSSSEKLSRADAARLGMNLSLYVTAVRALLCKAQDSGMLLAAEECHDVAVSVGAAEVQ